MKIILSEIKLVNRHVHTSTGLQLFISNLFNTYTIKEISYKWFNKKIYVKRVLKNLPCYSIYTDN